MYHISLLFISVSSICNIISERVIICITHLHHLHVLSICIVLPRVHIYRPWSNHITHHPFDTASKCPTYSPRTKTHAGNVQNCQRTSSCCRTKKKKWKIRICWTGWCRAVSVNAVRTVFRCHCCRYLHACLKARQLSTRKKCSPSSSKNRGRNRYVYILE